MSCANERPSPHQTPSPPIAGTPTTPPLPRWAAYHGFAPSTPQFSEPRLTTRAFVLALALGAAALLLLTSPIEAQLSDLTQTPNAENAGIRKSLAEQVGAGQGDTLTEDSSLFVIARDPFRSIRRGRQLFQRKFTHQQGSGPRTGDGTGEVETDVSIVAGFSDSCAGCHGRPRGSAGVGGNVFTRPDSRDAPHLFGLGLQEMLADEITRDLRELRDAAVADAVANAVSVEVELTSKGIHYGHLTAQADGSVSTDQIEGVDDDLRVRPFFAEGSSFSIREFIVGAFNDEMGLEALDPILNEAAAGGQVVTPSGLELDGSIDRINSSPVSTPGDDVDQDGVIDEIDAALVDHLEFYLLNYFKPASYRERPALIDRGMVRLDQWGCTSCHIRDLQIEVDRRVADVETQYDSGLRDVADGPDGSNLSYFNALFAAASPLLEEIDDGTGLPTLKAPLGNPFLVRDVFTDLKRHDLGPAFWEIGFDGSIQREFMTEPLWGVASTGPYGHDGRSLTLDEVIRRHGGEAEEASRAYANAPRSHQLQALAALESLVLFAPDDTPSNLDGGDPGHPEFPQRGHGSIALTVLFNDPTDIE